MQSAATETHLRQELLFALVLETLQQDRYEEDAGDDARELAVADLLLTVARAERLLQPSDANANAGVLGLTLAALRRGVGLSDEQQLRALEETAQLVLLPRIERKLRLKCSELCDVMLPGLVHANQQPQQQQQHHQGGDAAETTSSLSTSASTATSSSFISATSSALSSSSLLSRAAELPALLLEAQAKKAQITLENRQRKEQLRLQLQQDIERCRAMAELVAQLLLEHKRDDQTRVLLTKIQWLAAFSKAMRLKAQVLASQLAVETYPPASVAVLQAAHEELQRRKTRALEERDTLRAKLQLYQSTDAEYHSIAQEYGAVLLSMDEKRSWLRSLDL